MLPPAEAAPEAAPLPEETREDSAAESSPTLSTRTAVSLFPLLVLVLVLVLLRPAFVPRGHRDPGCRNEPAKRKAAGRSFLPHGILITERRRLMEPQQPYRGDVGRDEVPTVGWALLPLIVAKPAVCTKYVCTRQKIADAFDAMPLPRAKGFMPLAFADFHRVSGDGEDYAGVMLAEYCRSNSSKGDYTS